MVRTGALEPSPIGLIDGTHIPISKPRVEQPELYRNGKTYFSVNVQVVSGPDDELFDIVCRWPGSTHDSRIFDCSGIRVLLEREHDRLGWLLADAGYAQREYIFTPVNNPTTEAERRYNRAHRVTHSGVERTIGRLKRRFPCLYYELHNSLQNTLRIITACAVLYNIGIGAADPAPDEDEVDLEHLDVPERPIRQETGAAKRRQFIQRHFM
ncbi:hypothetical protein GE061_001313 [Apolygus lucorum]|uniref:DDE Tnp4 domain-containing protein n=1 Tax=Apolygus lucorum TaxID=248454 RepID=A0A8S9Y6Q2_APOLU|nr:hypothetical protein GE061_001313 [Apolygus lucorum]